MIQGIEVYYQQIADAISDAIPEDWATALMEVTFHDGSIDYHGEYTRSVDGVPRSFGTPRIARDAFKDIRSLFKQSGKPLWGSATFNLDSNGQFNMKWNYDDCDENGYARYDSEAWLKRQEEDQYRLTRPGLVEP